MLNSIVTLKHVDDGVDRGAVPRTSTINTLDDVCIKTVSGTIQSQCVYDGGDTGSIHGIGAVELPVGDDRKSSKTTDANDNFAPEAFTSLDVSSDELLAA